MQSLNACFLRTLAMMESVYNIILLSDKGMFDAAPFWLDRKVLQHELLRYGSASTCDFLFSMSKSRRERCPY